MHPGKLALAGQLERRIPGIGEAAAAFRIAQLLGPERVAADGARGMARGAGDGERGDEGALGLGRPIVDVGAALDRIERAQVADVGESVAARTALRPAAVADYGDEWGHGGLSAGLQGIGRAQFEPDKFEIGQ